MGIGLAELWSKVSVVQGLLKRSTHIQFLKGYFPWLFLLKSHLIEVVMLKSSGMWQNRSWPVIKGPSGQVSMALCGLSSIHVVIHAVCAPLGPALRPYVFSVPGGPATGWSGWSQWRSTPSLSDSPTFCCTSQLLFGWSLSTFSVIGTSGIKIVH